jgi:putative transposase
MIPNVEERFKQIVHDVCDKLDIEVIAMECDNDHAHLFLSCPPIINPADVIKYIKGATGKILLREIPQLNKMPHLWTRSYFVSTAGNVSSETIKIYVENQKKRY